MSAPTTQKYCKDCAHFMQGKGAPKCHAPGALKVDLVFGLLPVDCYDARQLNGACGGEGSLFLPIAIATCATSPKVITWIASKLFTEPTTSPSIAPPALAPEIGKDSAP